MTVESSYEPELFQKNAAYNGYPLYWFTMESIGLEAIEVYEVDALADTKTLIPITDYYINFPSTPPIYDGGIVVFTRQHPENVTHVRLERNTRITQLVDFPQVGIFHPDSFEFALDKATMICQEIAARKCDDPEGTPGVTYISQTVDFYSGGLFTADVIEATMQKLVDIIIEIEASKEECLGTLGNP